MTRAAAQDQAAGAHGEQVSPAPRVRVFTTPTCPWCKLAKVYLRRRKVAFHEVDVSRDAAAARDLVERTGQMGVPVIEIDGTAVVGFDRRQIDRLLTARS
jgi:glutaredoxin 3